MNFSNIQTLQGTSHLVFDSVDGITNMVEQMHETISRHPLPWSSTPAPAPGLIAPAVYSAIRGANGLLRESFTHLSQAIGDGNVSDSHSIPKTKFIAALNGAIGDHLEDTGNPLAIPMGFTMAGNSISPDTESIRLALGQVSPHVVILVHGLCLSELGWNDAGKSGVVSQLREQLGYSVLSLRYNSGRHISTNGKELTQLLDSVYQNWPVPIESLSLVGHSMGGLLIRSACHYADQSDSSWLPCLQRVVCLGTPHHGSPVEKAGHSLNLALQSNAYTEPLAIGRHRSNGIKDLHYGNLLDQDWLGNNAGKPRRDNRTLVPLLTDVDYYFGAANLRPAHDRLAYVLGDLLVSLDSAMGWHADVQRRLAIRPENCRVFHTSSHFDLLFDEQVHHQIIKWFKAD